MSEYAPTGHINGSWLYDDDYCVPLWTLLRVHLGGVYDDMPHNTCCNCGTPTEGNMSWCVRCAREDDERAFDDMPDLICDRCGGVNCEGTCARRE